jgi:hypothetical protein
MENELMEKFVKITNIFLQPLLKLRKNITNGDDIYEYLYFSRNGIEDIIEGAIKEQSNITVVGKPGQGKTSLINYMFIKLKRKKEVFPIVVDFREIGTQEIQYALMEFIIQIKEYFKLIKYPCTQITEEPNTANCYDQFYKVTKHLETIPKKSLNPRLVIFLDDLDYAPETYLEVLKKHFITFAASDKSVLVLSVRQPLHNEIMTTEELRQRYYILPHEIQMTDGNLQLLIQRRLLSVLKHKINTPERFLDKFRKVFSEDTFDKALLNYAKELGISFDNEGELEKLELPFSNEFYGYLSDIMYFNLRNIEKVFPSFLKRELSGIKPSFNENFIDAFIEETYDDKLILLDLVTDKTTGAKKVHIGNSIFQNVLEYFYFFENKNQHFFDTMRGYGITKEEAISALKKLTREPYTLIDPKFVYNENTHIDIYEHYFINIKGIFYIDSILTNNLYYKLKNLKKSNRSYYKDNKKI